jgi:splicing factor 3B subunit 1
LQLVDTTVEIANKVGTSEIISRVVDDLKDENEQYRKMVMETIEKIMGNLGAADIDSRLEEQLIDGILYAFQEQTTEVNPVVLQVNCADLFICIFLGCGDVEWIWYHC